MKRICLLSFAVQIILFLIMVAARILNFNGAIDESLARGVFSYSGIAFVSLTPLSAGSAFMSFMALLMLKDKVFKKIWSDHIAMGYPHTWLLWREVKEKYQREELK